MNSENLKAHERLLNAYRSESIYRALRMLRLSHTREDETRKKGHGLTEGVRLTQEGDIIRMRVVFVQDDSYACWDDYDVSKGEFEPLMADMKRILTGK